MHFISAYRGRLFIKNTLERFSFKFYSTKVHNAHCWRSHSCGELRKEHIDTEVTLCGWVEFKRPKKFLVLRDWHGSVQLLLSTGSVKSISLESVIKAKGVVKSRPDKDVNPNMDTGEIEVHIDSLDILNASNALPFPINEFSHINEEIRMQYRYLDIRTNKMQRNLRVRSQIISSMREFLIQKYGFVEIETPTLFRPTPGGAREFLVPSPIGPDLYYSLPQSPQQFKQLLMVAGMDRYFQVARCYRDEGARPDRQPEFSQLDLEMSFVSVTDIINLIESMIKHIWPRTLSDAPFPSMTFDHAMDKYGMDKPDIRFEMTLSNVTEFFDCKKLPHSPNFVYAFVIPENYSDVLNSNVLKKLLGRINDYFKDSITKQSVLKRKNNQFEVSQGEFIQNCISEDFFSGLDVKKNETIYVAWDETNKVRERLGKIRLFVAEILEENGFDLRPRDIEQFLWVKDFPLFKPKPDGGLKSVHHLFTAPHPDDLHLLETDPLKARSLAYDLVLNGSEVAGGSIRIHDSSLQRRILEEFLKIDSSQLETFLRGLNSGAPPHGGIAVGLDRLVAEYLGTKSIRDVIAFPKTVTGRDLMCNSPCAAEKDDLERYFLSKKT